MIFSLVSTMVLVPARGKPVRQQESGTYVHGWIVLSLSVISLSGLVSPRAEVQLIAIHGQDKARAMAGRCQNPTGWV